MEQRTAFGLPGERHVGFGFRSQENLVGAAGPLGEGLALLDHDVEHVA